MDYDVLKTYFDINVKVGSFKSGNNISTLSSISTLVVSGTNTLVVAVDDVTSGTITMPTDTYESNASVAKELEEAINNDSTLSVAGKSVSVLWDGNNYQIVSKTSTDTASVNVSSITTALDTHLKFSSSLGGATSDIAKYRVKYTDAAWLGGTATAVNSSSNLVVASGDNTFQLSVDGTSSGTVTLPAATYTSNGAVSYTHLTLPTKA